ncbi:MAG: phosphoribosyl-ATP pyrophosphatase, partial [Anaerolineales bacterium]|nr:phosphoribosyl-ATP pyrophosphatase [Anaerolineales bacterium]
SETADLFYHVLVLLAERDLSLAQVEAELERRHR